MHSEHCSNIYKLRACQSCTTYTGDPQKSVSVGRQLFANIINSIQCRTEHHESTDGDGSAALFDLASNQADASMWLQNDASDVISNS